MPSTGHRCTQTFCVRKCRNGCQGSQEDSKNFMSLNGTRKFFWVRNAMHAPRISGKPASTIKVGTTFRCREYGNSRIRRPYLHQRRLWMAQPFWNNPPTYRLKKTTVLTVVKIMVPADWKGKDIIAHFGAVSSKHVPVVTVSSLATAKTASWKLNSTWLRTWNRDRKTWLLSRCSAGARFIPGRPGLLPLYRSSTRLLSLYPQQETHRWHPRDSWPGQRIQERFTGHQPEPERKRKCQPELLDAQNQTVASTEVKVQAMFLLHFR